MSIPVRGLIEGFYGPPWTFEDRHRAVRFLAERGGTSYVYAPKNDPLHRDRWREPYLPDEWERFARLRRDAAALGVDLWFGLSPLGLRVSDGQDVERLLAKVAAADAHGLTDLCLLVDDMPEAFGSSQDAERFRSLAAAHARTVDVVRDAQRAAGSDRRMWFVPLHYHGDPDDDYVREIGELVDPEVAVMWTGPEVCSEVIPAEHGEAVAASLRRPVLYWDNHPVNDGDMRFDPHLNPFTGRDPRLVSSTRGILANVALEPESSLIALATLLEFARDPIAYDPAVAWRRALHEVCGDEDDADAVALLADLAPRSPLRRGEPRFEALDPLVRFGERWQVRDERRRALDDVAASLGRLGGTAERLRDELGNRRLRDDLAPWSRKLCLQLDAAIMAVGVLDDALRGGPSAHVRAARIQVLDLLEGARRTFHRVAGDRLEVFARACLRRADELVDGCGRAP